MAGRKDATIVLLAVQFVFVILFAFLTDYEDIKDARGNTNSSSVSHTEAESELHHTYPMFQDVHVMMFIGFGFLMTFLKKYGYGAVSFNFLIAAIVLQWATLCQGFYHAHHDDSRKIHLSITNLLNADLASASVLISFGAVLGVATPLQLVVMALCEVAVFATNEHLGLSVLQVSDVGASMLVHVFGAYFGLAVSYVILNRRRGVGASMTVNTANEGASYTSDLFAMIGTIFLWLFWPSFNAVLAVDETAQQRAVVNTYFSLAACCVTAFAISSLLSKENKFDMVHIQNSTLAGGVAIGTAADMMVQPWGAMIVGSIAGTVSVVGYRYVIPVMNKKLGVHDTCGVHNLHGMPGILAALVGAIAAGMATVDQYGYGLYRQFPARIPAQGSAEYEVIQLYFGNDQITAGFGRTAGKQAAFQMAALFMTLSVALISGLLTGLFLQLPVFTKLPRDRLFDDELYWELPVDEENHHEEAVALEPQESCKMMNDDLE